MRKEVTYIGATLSLIALPVLGYVLAHALTPDSNTSTFHRGLLTLLITLFLLLVPYWMLKIFGHASHVWDPEEREWRLKDMPKDKDQLKNQP